VLLHENCRECPSFLAMAQSVSMSGTHAFGRIDDTAPH
jgi:hypothetical protein